MFPHLCGREFPAPRRGAIIREGYLFLKKRYPSLVYAPCLQGELFNDYFLKLSFSVTDLLNTR